MIEVTDEMRMAAYRAAREWAAQHGHPYPDDRMVDVSLAAVLAIVERGQAGPCSETLPPLLGLSDVAVWCSLRHGHVGDHESGLTRWREGAADQAEPRWRCNTTERCFREDGHGGRHGFAWVRP